MRLPFNWVGLTLLSQVIVLPANADELIFYCAEKHIVGLQIEQDRWVPSYGDEEYGRRYAIRFNEDLSEMSGFQGTDTVYQCGRSFPTKARDVVTCINPLVATMVFNYSIESGRFLFSLVDPGGWLGVGTERHADIEQIGDALIMGTCQDF